MRIIVEPKKRKPIVSVPENLLPPAPKKARAKKEKDPGPVEEPLKVYRTYEDFDEEMLFLYAGLDNICTNTVMAKMAPLVFENPVHYQVGSKGEKVATHAISVAETYESITRLALDYILDLEINGIRYDVEGNKKTSEAMQAEIDRLELEIRKVVPAEYNLDSAVDMSEFLYVVKGFTPPHMTKSNEPSTDGEAYLVLAGLNPMSPPKDYVTPDPEKQWLAYMAKRRDLNSVHNSFVKTYVQDYVKRDGKIHPSYNLHGTSGFRISGDNPNLLALPRTKHNFNLRNLYLVEDGYVMILADLSSAEVKILAALCQDPGMVKAINEGLDFHSYSASSMKGVSYDDYMAVLADKSHPLFKEYKDLRQTAKILTFSILYGSSAAGIAMQLMVTKEEAERLMALYFDAYPKMKTFIESSHKEALWNQAVRTVFGQTRREYGSYECFKNTAAFNGALRNSSNVLVQSTTSTLGLILFAKINEAIKKLDPRCKSLCTVYDSTEVCVPIEHAAKVVEIMFYYLNVYPQTIFPWLTHQIGCEVELGIRWGDAEVVHEGVTQEECERIIATKVPSPY